MSAPVSFASEVTVIEYLLSREEREDKQQAYRQINRRKLSMKRQRAATPTFDLAEALRPRETARPFSARLVESARRMIQPEQELYVETPPTPMVYFYSSPRSKVPAVKPSNQEGAVKYSQEKADNLTSMEEPIVELGIDSEDEPYADLALLTPEPELDQLPAKEPLHGSYSPPPKLRLDGSVQKRRHFAPKASDEVGSIPPSARNLRDLLLPAPPRHGTFFPAQVVPSASTVLRISSQMLNVGEEEHGTRKVSPAEASRNGAKQKKAVAGSVTTSKVISYRKRATITSWELISVTFLFVKLLAALLFSTIDRTARVAEHVKKAPEIAYA